MTQERRRVKSKYCTASVGADIISRKKKGFTADEGTTFEYTVAKVKYYYGGRSYTTKVSIGLNNYVSFVPLKVNPENPRMHILADRKLLISTAIISAITGIADIALAIGWIIFVM